ncbi:MAG: outer membrane beta-barrel protein [Bacteroidetes bacterium]|nr:outer membrane beta-barrel protein [Bacteroidota bacterium]
MKTVLFSSLMCVAVAATAQFGINAGVNALKFTGDVGKQRNTHFFNDARMGYNLGAEYRVGKILGVGLNGMYGKLQGSDFSKESHRNFMSTVIGGELNVTAYFDRMKDTSPVASPFISVGLGFLKFDPKGDITDANGIKYNYWSDGSIRDLPESPANDPYAIVMQRDYTYETQLTDSAVNYKRNTLYLPINLGIKFNVDYRISVKVAMNYNLAFTDYIDNYKNGGNDSWMGANVSVNYSLNKKPKSPYDGVDFKAIDNSDYDTDGIVDLKDNCLGTPKGAKVGNEGCAVDTDMDGTPDYMDNEPNTKPGALTDGYGVTINEEDYAARQLEWDSLATSRSGGFNEMPSLDYLKQVETKGKEIKEKSGKTASIPAELKSADVNNDGYISADEIRKTIDMFFEGESDFNVERINRLIDFFFEQ